MEAGWFDRLGIGAAPRAEPQEGLCSEGCGRQSRREGGDCRQCYKNAWKRDNYPTLTHFDTLEELDILMHTRPTADGGFTENGRKKPFDAAE